MKKKMIVLAIAAAVVIMAFILKSVLASGNSSKEGETDTSKIIIETITSDSDATEVSQTSADTETVTDATSQQDETTGIGIVVETLPPEETPSAAETTVGSSIIIEYSTIGDPETTKAKKSTKKKKKKTEKETTKRSVKDTPTYSRETQTQKREKTTKKAKTKKKLGTYYESNIISSSKISIIKNSILSSVNGSSDGELTSLARYMSAHKSSNASSTYKSLTGNSIKVSVKTCSVNIESDANDNIMTAAQRAASKIGKVSGTYGIGVSSFKAKSGYTIFVAVVYK